MESELKDISGQRCISCGSGNIGVFCLKDGIHILKCAECGLAFNLEMKNRESLADIYSEEYFFGGDVGYGYDNYLSEKDNYLATFRKRFRFVDKYKKGGKLLSVGCAFGFCLEVARLKGWEVTGVEISKVASDWARRNLGLDVRNSTLAEARFPDNSFDAVLMWGYIQESLEPLEEIAEAYRILKPGGVLFIQTQDNCSLHARITKEKWIQFKPRTTSYYFSGRSARKLLKKAGFTILEMTSRGMGQYCSLGFLLSRIACVVPFFRNMNTELFRNRSLKKTSVYLNLFDFLHICAKKEG